LLLKGQICHVKFDLQNLFKKCNGFFALVRPNVVFLCLMKKSRFLSPYTKDGKTRFPARFKSGVYLIKSRTGEMLYIGSSGTDVYKTCYRHLQIWSSFQKVVTYVNDLENILLRVVYCTPKQALELEKKLIWKHSPKDNVYQYENEELENDYYREDVFDKYQDIEITSFKPVQYVDSRFLE